MAEKTGNKNGMNWITPHKRLAIYMRDGLACIYCGSSVETGCQFTLDHLKPRSKGGTNDESNLVTACIGCNAARGNRSCAAFLRILSERTGTPAVEIWNAIRRQTRRVLASHVSQAKDMIAQRGCFSAALASTKETSSGSTGVGCERLEVHEIPAECGVLVAGLGFEGGHAGCDTLSVV